MRRPVNRPEQDSAGAAGAAEPTGVSAQPEPGGDAGQEASQVERRELVDTLDVVPAVGAGAALGARRTQ